MSDRTKRISALISLIAGSPALVGAPLHSRIIDELNEVVRVSRLEPRRRCRLLQILHSGRSLDSALAAFLNYHGCRNNRSLGGYLRTLADLKHLTRRRGAIPPSNLSQHARHRYQKSIVDNRNRYMHESGEYPVNDDELSNLLAEMHDCLTTVLSL